MLIWGGLTVNCSKAPSVTHGCYVFPSLPKPVLMCAALGHPPAVALLGGGAALMAAPRACGSKGSCFIVPTARGLSRSRDLQGLLPVPA